MKYTSDYFVDDLKLKIIPGYEFWTSATEMNLNVFQFAKSQSRIIDVLSPSNLDNIVRGTPTSPTNDEGLTLDVNGENAWLERTLQTSLFPYMCEFYKKNMPCS